MVVFVALPLLKTVWEPPLKMVVSEAVPPLKTCCPLPPLMKVLDSVYTSYAKMLSQMAMQRI